MDDAGGITYDARWDMVSDLCIYPDDTHCTCTSMLYEPTYDTNCKLFFKNHSRSKLPRMMAISSNIYVLSPLQFLIVVSKTAPPMLSCHGIAMIHQNSLYHEMLDPLGHVNQFTVHPIHKCHHSTIWLQISVWWMRCILQ